MATRGRDNQKRGPVKRVRLTGSVSRVCPWKSTVARSMTDSSSTSSCSPHPATTTAVTAPPPLRRFLRRRLFFCKHGDWSKVRAYTATKWLGGL